MGRNKEQENDRSNKFQNTGGFDGFNDLLCWGMKIFRKDTNQLLKYQLVKKTIEVFKDHSI